MAQAVRQLSDACLLRILLGESDKYEGHPLYEWIVKEARRLGLAGATAARGMMGFGAGSVIHTFKIERLSEDLPVIVEIVDERAKVEAFLAAVEPFMRGGLATLERVDARFYHG
jgi:PII-like signaling protein